MSSPTARAPDRFRDETDGLFADRGPDDIATDVLSDQKTAAVTTFEAHRRDYDYDIDGACEATRRSRMVATPNVRTG